MLLAISSATHVCCDQNIFVSTMHIYGIDDLRFYNICWRLSFSNFWCGYRCRGFFAHVDSFEKERTCCCIHKFIDMRLALNMIGNTRVPFHFFSFNRLIMQLCR